MSHHLHSPPNGTSSFKRTFEEFGYDSHLQASGSGTAGSTINANGNERNKRARSTSTSSHSDNSSTSSQYSTARSTASLTNNSLISTTSPSASPPTTTLMSSIPHHRPLSVLLPSTTPISLQRFNQLDTHIPPFRPSQSRTPSWRPTPSPVLSSLHSSNDNTRPIDNWDWSHFAPSPPSSHTSDQLPHPLFTPDPTSSIASAATAYPHSLSFHPSDALSRSPSVDSSSNISTSTSSFGIPPPTDHAFDTPHNSHPMQNTSSSNLPHPPLPFSRSSPTVPSFPDLPTPSDLLDNVFEPQTSNHPTRPHTPTRTIHSGIASRTTSSSRTSTNPSPLSSAFEDPLSPFHSANEQPHQGPSNTFGDHTSTTPFRSPARSQESAARARTFIARSRNSGRPFSQVFAALEPVAHDSNQAQSSVHPFLAGFDGDDSIDDAFNDRRSRVAARNRYNPLNEDSDDMDDAIIQGLHNARGLLERGVETARSLSGAPRPDPNPPHPRYRSRFYGSATTVASNSLVSESAAELRRTNARAQLRSQVPSFDEPPPDHPEFSSLTAASRLRRLIALQSDISSDPSSRSPLFDRPTDPSSRPSGFNSFGPPSRDGSNERERLPLTGMSSNHRYSQTRSENSRSPNHVPPENSLDSIFDPVFSQMDALPELSNPAEGGTRPPYVYRPPTPPLRPLRDARSRSPLGLSSERAQASASDPSTRSHLFSNVNLDVFPPGIYRDSLRRSIQASQGRNNPRAPERTPSSTFSFNGNSDEDDDSNDMDSFGDPSRHGRGLAETRIRFTPRRMTPEPVATPPSLASGLDSRDMSMRNSSTFTGVRGRIPPIGRQPSDEHLGRHRLNESGRGIPNPPLDSIWSSDRHNTPAQNPEPVSWDVSEATDRLRAIRDLMDRYDTNSERSESLPFRRDSPPPHQGPFGRSGNPSRYTLQPWRPSLGDSFTPTSSESASDSNRSAMNTHIPYRHAADRSRERQEVTASDEHTPIRTLRQRAGLARGTLRTDVSRARSMFMTMARRNLGDYMPDELFDSSYEGLLSLGEALGEVRSKATPGDVVISLPTGTYQAWAKEGSETRCPICLDDYGQDDPVTKLVECSHWLHKSCLEQWLRTANTCPVCRKKVKGSPTCTHNLNPSSTTITEGAGDLGSRAPATGASSNHAESPSGVVGIRDLINRARRVSNGQLGRYAQQQSPARGDAPAEPVFDGDGSSTHFHHHHHHHHHHYLHVHASRPELSQGPQFADHYNQTPVSTPSAARFSAGPPNAVPSIQNGNGGHRPNLFTRPALSRPSSWFGSMASRGGSTRRMPEATRNAHFPGSSTSMDYESSSFGRAGFASASASENSSSGFHQPASMRGTSGGVFLQTAGSSSSSSASAPLSAASNMFDTHARARTHVHPLAAQPSDGASWTNVGRIYGYGEPTPRDHASQ